MALSPTPGTDQSNGLQQVQRQRKHMLAFGIGICIALLIVTASSWRASEPRLYNLVEHWGVFLIVLCILGRTWCTLYIGGFKRRELICKGPYSVVRNPLYTFTIIGAAGIGAQSGSIANTFIFAAVSLVRKSGFSVHRFLMRLLTTPPEFRGSGRSSPRGAMPASLLSGRTSYAGPFSMAACSCLPYPLPT